MEGSRSGNPLLEKLRQVDGAAFTAQSPTRDTLAVNFLALVVGDVLVMLSVKCPIAFLEVAVERFALVDPDYTTVSSQLANRRKGLTLECALCVLLLASKCDLRLFLQHLENLAICPSNVSHRPPTTPAS